MTQLTEILDVDNLAVMVAEKLITAKPGPHGLTLYNYTQRAQFTRTWNRETTTCRGLIARDDGTVQARPFGKFFNVAEHDSPHLPDLPAEPFRVFEKLDGSLIVASRLPDGETLLTTRGSFNSEQAIAAQQWWTANNHDETRIPGGQTWLFEWIAPWNRIVVDYGDRSEMVMLAVIDNATGLDLPIPVEWPDGVVDEFDGLTDFDLIADYLANLGSNDEGCVIRFAGGLRAKAKGDEYVRLHRLLTNVSARTIWECLAAGDGLDDLVERVPDEFHAWVTATRDDLLAQFGDIASGAHVKLAEVAALPSRKEQAFALADCPHRAVVFSLLDGKPVDSLIWRGLRPDADLPFRADAA